MAGWRGLDSLSLHCPDNLLTLVSHSGVCSTPYGLFDHAAPVAARRVWAVWRGLQGRYTALPALSRVALADTLDYQGSI